MIWIHGTPARDWQQVVEYLSGDAHDRSKVQVLIDGRFHDLAIGRRNTPVRPQEAPGAPEMARTTADTTPSEMASEIQSEIDSGKEAARTIPQLVSAIRQNLAGAGADLHSLNLLVSRIEHAVTKEEYDRLLDVLASLKNHITKLDAKATLAKEDKDK